MLVLAMLACYLLQHSELRLSISLQSRHILLIAMLFRVKAETECPLYMFSNTKLSVQKKHLNKTQVVSLSLCNQSESSFHHTPWLICVSFSRRTIVKEVLNGEANPKTEGRDGHFEFESNFLNVNFKLVFLN